MQHPSRFVGTIPEWETLASDFGLRCNVTPIWRGAGTVLFVMSMPNGDPVPHALLGEWRGIVEEYAPVGCFVTVVSVG